MEVNHRSSHPGKGMGVIGSRGSGAESSDRVSSDAIGCRFNEANRVEVVGRGRSARPSHGVAEGARACPKPRADLEGPVHTIDGGSIEGSIEVHSTGSSARPEERVSVTAEFCFTRLLSTPRSISAREGVASGMEVHGAGGRPGPRHRVDLTGS